MCNPQPPLEFTDMIEKRRSEMLEWLKADPTQRSFVVAATDNHVFYVQTGMPWRKMDALEMMCFDDLVDLGQISDTAGDEWYVVTGTPVQEG